jgi:chromosome segregation ATPase
MNRWRWSVRALVEVLGSLRRELARLRRELRVTRIKGERERASLREKLDALDAEIERLHRESDDDASRIGVRDNEIERLELALADAERERDALLASRGAPADGETARRPGST